jgi:hypothetical protein
MAFPLAGTGQRECQTAKSGSTLWHTRSRNHAVPVPVPCWFLGGDPQTPCRATRRPLEAQELSHEG